MPLIELIRGSATDDATEAAIRELAARLEKQVIVSADRPGFIVNRILMPLLGEAMRAYEQGVGTAEDIDTGARIGLNHPMGPLALADFIGLDVVLGIMRVLHEGFGEPQFAPPAVLERLVAEGHLGRSRVAGSTSTRAEARRRHEGRQPDGRSRTSAASWLRSANGFATTGEPVGVREVGEARVAGVARHEDEPAAQRRIGGDRQRVQLEAGHRPEVMVGDDRAHRPVSTSSSATRPVAASAASRPARRSTRTTSERTDGSSSHTSTTVLAGTTLGASSFAAGSSAVSPAAAPGARPASRPPAA